MFLLWFALIVAKTYAISGTATEIGHMCLPSDLVHWEKPKLYSQIHRCLATNYVRGVDKVRLDSFVDAYLNAFTSLQNTNVADDQLYYAKKDLIQELKNVQLKTTHHAHAIIQCAGISKKIPVDIMSSAANEGKYAEIAADVWKHHINQDIIYCKEILLTNIKNHNKHMVDHIHSIYYEYLQNINHLKQVQDEHYTRKNILQQTRAEIIRRLV
jgi:hypothetical protein